MRRVLSIALASLAMLMLALMFGGIASAAIQRPNALDRRVDSLTQSELMAEPATALVDPARQAAAVRRAHWTLWGWIAIQLFAATALFYLWSSGSAARMRDWLRRRLRSEWEVRFFFGAALGLVARVAGLIPSFYLYRVDRILQLSPDLTRTWALFWIFHTLLGMIVAGLIAAGVLWLVERTHQWYAYAILGILAASVVWSYASPYIEFPGVQSMRPIGTALSATLQPLLVRAHVQNVAVFQTADNSGVAEAVVLGPGGSRRIVLSHGLIAGDTEPEIEYQIAYALDRITRGLLLSVALIEGGVIIVFSAIAIVIADRIRFRRDDDPVSRLAIVGSLLAIVYIIAVPVRNAALRSYDLDADRYAVALTGNPSAAVRALIRTSDQRMIEVCPETAATLFLYTAAGIGGRVAAINHVRSTCR
jgi:Zn-dependent protease with chaperone function